jgi:hypothetical protein
VHLGKAHRTMGAEKLRSLAPPLPSEDGFKVPEGNFFASGRRLWGRIDSLKILLIKGERVAGVRRVFSSELREFCAVSILLGLAIAEGRLSTLSVIAAITVISSIAAVPVMSPGFGRRAIAVPVPPLL